MEEKFDEEKKILEMPEFLPLLPVRDIVVFPYMTIPLFVGRESSIRAVDESLSRDRLIFLATQKDPTIENPNPDEIFSMGTIATILKMLKLPDGRVKILIQGISRGRIISYTDYKPCYRVRVERIVEKQPSEISLEVEALLRTVKERVERILTLRSLPAELSMITDNISDPGMLADIVASNLRLKIEESQKVLEIINPIERLHKINEILVREIEVSEMQAKIASQAKEEISKTQREYFLREQLRAIKQELGELDARDEEIQEFRDKIKKARMPAEVEKEAMKQLGRLEQMHPESAEAAIVRTYLDWLVELPWSKSTKDNLDLKKARKVLDEDHYDLEKVKERILEYLAVRKLKKDMKGSILCFVGPPGVGKTSLGKSIARALGRKFVRISLGGVHDEAEIRGHRRTYVGALPGRVIQGIKQAGTNNPVFMLDEVDKIGADFRGDPSAALLEVLDPEQNFSFSDHYLGVPFDLSKVMFITTANLVDPILPALKDRMEIIRLAGYTEEEKLKIAMDFLIPKQLKEHGLTNKYLSISPKAIMKIILEYTKEAGLRNLEREIATICRKVAKMIAEGRKGIVNINANNIFKFLGPPRFLPETEQERDEIGVATGLAWTESGGDILYVEATILKGKGNLILTGHLGEVMKESAQAALSYARAKMMEWERKEDFSKMDIHIHVPAGAIPKDGPSAGVTMATALISALLRVPVKREIAMTGEVTLRGRVLPVGGIKEKSLAAARSGIKCMIIPEKNQKDIEEVPSNIRKKMEFKIVKHMDEILDVAFKTPVIKSAGISGQTPRVKTI